MLVVLVIFLFLRNISATIIPSLALPASIVGTFAAMYLLGYSLDNLSLMALTLSVGFVVDDAIVMLENIVRHMEHGEDAMTAALSGSQGDRLHDRLDDAVARRGLHPRAVHGRDRRPAAARVRRHDRASRFSISGFVSLSLTPMLASRFLKAPSSQRHGRMYMAIERVFDGALRVYGWSLNMAMRNHALTMAVSALLLVATVYAFRIIPMGFIPSQDIGQINGQTEMAQGLGYESMVEHQLEVMEIIRADPNVKSVTSSIGGGGGPGGGGSNGGRFFIELKPRAERDLTADQVIAALRPKVAAVPGVRVFLTNPPVINLGGRAARAQYQFTMQGGDTTELYAAATELESKLDDVPGLVDVSSDLLLTNPQVNVTLDRERIAALGLTADQVESALDNAFGSRQVAQIYAPNNAYQVIMRVAPEYQRDASALSLLYLRTADNKQVPLSSVTRVDTGVGPLVGQPHRPAAVGHDLVQPAPGRGARRRRRARSNRSRAPNCRPRSRRASRAAAQAFQDSTRGLGVILLMAIFVIYVVLGILYESFIHPLTILSGLPSAGLGALATLLVFGVDLNIYAFVGVIMLVGLVKKNGIMMIDFAIDAQRTQGKSPAEAMFEACLVRFRPIMMTTMAALVGTLPIALGWGAGAEARRPLGLAVVGGLVVSQTLTLYITPVFYLYMEALSGLLRGHRAPIAVKFDRAALMANGRTHAK